MKKVLHISKYYYPFIGGTEQIARECVKALKENYIQKVICFNSDIESIVEVVDDVEIIRAGVYATISSQGISSSIGKKIKDEIAIFNPDVIIFHYPNPFVARYILKYLPNKCRLIIYWHLDIIRQKFLKNFFIVQNIRLVKRANTIIATSPTYVDGSRYLRRVGEKCVIVPNCINVDRLQVTPQVEQRAREIRSNYPNKVICLAVGRHTRYKGIKYLIKAAHQLDDRFEIFITGKGEETDTLISEAADDPKIHFLGLINDLELKAYMTAMDIFCFPSITRNEAFGVALAEGMYYGKPTVTFTIPGSGVNYVSINGKTGIEVENRNVSQYAAAIKKLADDPDLCRELGSAGKRRVEENFLDEQFRANILHVVEKTIGDNSEK